MGCLPLKFKNTGIGNTNVVVSIAWDAAISYDSHITANGSFATTGPTSGDWSIGDFDNGDYVELNICFTGPDGTYEVAWDLNGDIANATPSVGVCEVTLTTPAEPEPDGNPCADCEPPFAQPQDLLGYLITGCILDQINYNSKGCKTFIKVKDFSEKNISNIILNCDNGNFKLNPACVTEGWEFQYEIYFTDCPSDCYPAGHAPYGPFIGKVSGPSLLDGSKDVKSHAPNIVIQ